MQQPPASHVFAEQHVSPGPPHARHALFLHTVPSAQTLFGQQAWPGPPQVTQFPPAQLVPGSVQASPTVQQTCPVFPQFDAVHCPP